MPTQMNPCRDCSDRRPATESSPPCHASCPRYAAFVAERREIRAARDQQRVLDGYAQRSRAQRSAIAMQAAKRRRERTRR